MSKRKRDLMTEIVAMADKKMHEVETWCTAEACDKEGKCHLHISKLISAKGMTCVSVKDLSRGGKCGVRFPSNNRG